MLQDSCVCIIKDSNSLDLRDNIHDLSCFFPDSLEPGYVMSDILHYDLLTTPNPFTHPQIGSIDV